MEVLENKRVRLEILLPDHASLLKGIAEEDKLIEYSPSDIGTLESLSAYILSALNGFKEGNAIPFAIFDKANGQYAGSTRYMNIDKKNKVLEIGSTWIGRAYQGSGLNTQMKILMLDHAFDQMDFEKVEFRIDERNIRSRKAVEKLGAILEGILRENVLLLEGYKRNTCCYGILKTEWKTNRNNFNI
ncbi:MAG: GNAT family N-acetyltransferase [Flavobacteriaceae bacterium]